MSPTAETLFAYPATPNVRRHGPCGYVDYTSYKPWLRDEFSFRCVYCLFRERWFPNGEGSFSADHVEPQSVAPHRICDYANLLYACLTCNSTRQDRATPDPCAVAFGTMLRVREDGVMDGLTPEGNALIQVLGLNHKRLCAFRCRILHVLARIQRARKDKQVDLAAWFGYPDDLPNLGSLRPPGGNVLPGGIGESHCERRLRGQLASTY